MLDAALDNLLSPMVLAFALGLIAGVVRSDLQVPDALGRALAIYLMFAIGLKGGAAMGANEDALARLVPALLVALAISFFLPFVAHALLRATTGLDRANAAAVAAHYGSISIVTFVAAAEFLSVRGIAYEGHLVAMVAVMETPAIVSGLLLAGGFSEAGADAEARRRRGETLRAALVNGSVVLLVGGFVIGWASGPQGMASIAPFFDAPFKGVLCLFLLEMGLLVARRLSRQAAPGAAVIAFGLYFPLIGAGVGLAAAALLGLSPGGAALLAVLAASASYIAVPAAMRLAVPEAEPSLYVALALGVTFPFNLVLGIPLYFFAAERLFG